MRVIAGQAKGIRLKSPAGIKTRPTGDRVKEALFNLLQNGGWLTGAAVLDLFAGSGSLGIEAISRGAVSATFVENSRNALEALRGNLSRCSFTEQADIIPLDAMLATRLLAEKNRLFDLILLDPPYRTDNYQQLIEISGSRLLKPDGLIMAETSKKTILPEKIGTASRTDRRVYGDTALEFFRTEKNI